MKVISWGHATGDVLITGFTHDSDDCSGGPENNPYTELESMKQKTMAQFALGELLYSVDNKVQASKLIDRHLIRDMRGNLRAFGQQSVRCPRCGAKYRRPPISGTCRTVLSEKAHDESVTGEDEIVMCDGNLILYRDYFWTTTAVIRIVSKTSY